MDHTEIFDEDGALTARFLARRGYCCANGCRNCPYVPRHGGLEAALRPEMRQEEPSVKQSEQSR